MEETLVMHCLARSRDHWTLTESGKRTQKEKKKLFEQKPHLPYQAWQYIAEQLMQSENKEPYMETDKKKNQTWMIVPKCSRIVLTTVSMNIICLSFTATHKNSLERFIGATARLNCTPEVAAVKKQNKWVCCQLKKWTYLTLVHINRYLTFKLLVKRQNNDLICSGSKDSLSQSYHKKIFSAFLRKSCMLRKHLFKWMQWKTYTTSFSFHSHNGGVSCTFQKRKISWGDPRDFRRRHQWCTASIA